MFLFCLVFAMSLYASIYMCFVVLVIRVIADDKPMELCYRCYI